MEQPAKPKVWRALLALAFPLISTVVLFGAFGTYFAVTRGLRGEEIGKAMEPIASIVVLINLSAMFLFAWWMLRKDGWTLGSVGWSLRGLNPAVELAIAVGAGVVFAALNHFVFFPVIRSLPQLGPAPFDPSLPMLTLPVLLVVQVVGAVAEDTLYRGYGLVQLRARWGVVAAVLITSIAHALFAFGSGPIVMVWHVFIAAFLASLAVWRKNVLVPFVAHLVLALTPRLVGT